MVLMRFNGGGQRRKEFSPSSEIPRAPSNTRGDANSQSDVLAKLEDLNRKLSSIENRDGIKFKISDQGKTKTGDVAQTEKYIKELLNL